MPLTCFSWPPFGFPAFFFLPVDSSSTTSDRTGTSGSHCCHICHVFSVNILTCNGNLEYGFFVNIIRTTAILVSSH
jgi:hypothetical protein